ncbi:NAD(P)H-binding protein [Pedobacter sp. SYSU D00535]|uniref:NmrA family NAD(P)-binding protein n=1 Tax=Pedobacter sp. SYSU D00535 TaxID=2810308 RepID=UPI001A95F160|nr:NAD(P)H-binding protein [Pedobacter sp. SYSU D00535]
MENLNIVLGATGQVGSYLINEIKRKGHPVRAVVRNPKKLRDRTIETRIADLFDARQLMEAFKGGTTVFILTPENPASHDIIGETQQIVDNYKLAIQAAGIKKVIGLSSVGAHADGNTGNLVMSKLLEEGVRDVDAEIIIVRPSYYFSNWLGYLETVKQYGLLPSFFPAGLKIEMNSPLDLAKFIAEKMITPSTSTHQKLFELTGPQKYSAADVANTLSTLLNRNVTAQSIPKEKWSETLLSVGFSENSARNLVDMTQAVIDNKTVPEYASETIKLPTTLASFLEQQLKQ